jgi:hypothetical protein
VSKPTDPESIITNCADAFPQASDKLWPMSRTPFRTNAPLKPKRMDTSFDSTSTTPSTTASVPGRFWRTLRRSGWHSSSSVRYATATARTYTMAISRLKTHL